MNYYEHHLGDYVRDTAHLSMLEDGACRSSWLIGGALMNPE